MQFNSLDVSYILAGVLGVTTHLFLKNLDPPRQPDRNTIAIFIASFILLTAASVNASGGFESVESLCSNILIIGIRTLVTVTLYLFTLLSSTTLYRLSPLHPLGSFPGPWYLKVSKAGGMYLSYTGLQHKVVHALHEKYGRFVRVGPNELSIVDEDAVQTILGAGGLNKGRYYDARKDPNAPGNLIVLSGTEHANRRRLWNRGMSSDALAEYHESLTTRVSLLSAGINRVGVEEGKPVDLVAWLSYFAFDFMGDMAFGGGFETLRDGEDKDGILVTLDNFAVSASVVSHAPWAAHTLQRLPAIAKDLQSLRGFAVGKATARLKAGAKVKDLWWHLSDEAGLEKTKPPMANVVSDGALAIIAGSDTTSSALASLFCNLLMNPRAYNLVRAEVDRLFHTEAECLEGGELGKKKFEQCLYLQACINETLRLNPPVPTNGPRQTASSSGMVISGRVVPPNTQIYVPPYSLHRDPTYFAPNPTEFLPERWLVRSARTGLTPVTDADVRMITEGLTMEEVNKEPKAFIPFSYGPANCAGKTLARKEMLMVAAVLIQRFEFKWASITGGPGVHDQEEEAVRRGEAWFATLRDHFVTTRGPLMVEVKAR